MTTIGTLHNALDTLSLNIAPDALSARPEGRPVAGENGTGDVDVSIDPKILKRIQAQLADEEPISSEQAMRSLDFVSTSSADDLAQAHGPLDAARVFQLLGLAS